jgi:hypothetical protein
MVVLAASEVDHTPTESATKGQLPFTLDESENCTSFPGAVALWSAVALWGVMLVVITHASLELPQQVAIKAHRSGKGNSQILSISRPALPVSVPHSD